MKNTAMAQLDILVGRCMLHHTRNLMTYSISIKIGNHTASTIFKQAVNDSIDFSTKLFLRIEKTLLQNHNKCSVIINAVDQNNEKKLIGSTLVSLPDRIKSPLSENITTNMQTIKISQCSCKDKAFQVELDFSISDFEPKNYHQPSKNHMNKTVKNNIQKQSSSLVKQSQPTKSAISQKSKDKKVKIKSNQEDKILKQSTSQKILPIINTKININKQKQQKQIKKSQITQDNNSSTQATFNINNFLHETQLIENKQGFMTQEKLQKQIVKLKTQIKELQRSLDEKIQIKLQTDYQLRAYQDQLRVQSDQLRVQQDQLRANQDKNNKLKGLLELEELKFEEAFKHIAFLDKIIESIDEKQSDEHPSISRIQEKDQILMINQELETQVQLYKIKISQYQKEIQSFREKEIQSFKEKDKDKEKETKIIGKNASPNVIKKNNFKNNSNSDFERINKELSKKNEELNKQIQKLKDQLKSKERQFENEKKVNKKNALNLPKEKNNELKINSLTKQINETVKIPKSRSNNKRVKNLRLDMKQTLDLCKMEESQLVKTEQPSQNSQQNLLISSRRCDEEIESCASSKMS